MSTACVVWDIDDTLYLERRYARSGFIAVGAWATDRLGVDGLGDICWERFEAGSRGRIFNEALEALTVEATPELIAETVGVYREHEPNIVLLPDAGRAVQALRNAGIAMAAITDGPTSSQRAKVKALGVNRFADPVLVTGDYGPGFGKPHPRAFRDVEDHLKLTGEQLAYVADNPAKDFVSPRQLGWRTVRIRRTGGLHAEVAGGSDIDVELSCLDELLPVLGIS